MTTIQDRIIENWKTSLERRVYAGEFPLGIKTEFIEQFILTSIKEVEEETRKEVVDECKQKMAQSNEWWNKKLLSITNKEIKK